MRAYDGSLFHVDWAIVTDPTATSLSFSHPFVSGRNDPTGFDTGVIGEIPNKYPPKSKAVPPKRLCVDGCYTGALEWWQSGWPDGTPPVELAPDGWAVECSKDFMSVTDVGLAMPPEFIVSGSPVTSIGVLSADWKPVPAGYVLSGPVSGPDAAPTFKPGPTPPRPYPLDFAAVYLDHSPAQYLEGGPFMWLPRFPNPWSVVLWYRSTIGIVPGNLIGNSDLSTQAWWVKTGSGTIDFGYSSGLSPVQIVSAPAAAPGTWQFVAFGYDDVAGEMWLATNGGGRFVAPLTLTPDILAATLRLNVQYYFGSLQAQNEGTYDCLGIFGVSMTDAETVAIYNNGDGLYYDNLPCRLFHGCDAFWPFDEPTGPYLDIVGLRPLVPVGGSSEDGGICGWRADRPTCLPGGGVIFVGPPWQPTLIVAPDIPKISTIEFVDTGGTPPPPVAGSVLLYQDAGNVLIEDSLGSVSQVAQVGFIAGGGILTQWLRVDLDYTDFVGTGSQSVPYITLPIGFSYGRAFGINTQAWLPSSPSGVSSVGVGIQPSSIDELLGSISGSLLNSVNTRSRPSPSVSNGDVNSVSATSTTLIYKQVTCAPGMAITAGHATIWIEIILP